MKKRGNHSEKYLASSGWLEMNGDEIMNENHPASSQLLSKSTACVSTKPTKHSLETLFYHKHSYANMPI